MLFFHTFLLTDGIKRKADKGWGKDGLYNYVSQHKSHKYFNLGTVSSSYILALPVAGILDMNAILSVCLLDVLLVMLEVLLQITQQK